MFDFYIAARQQRATGARVAVVRHKRGHITLFIRWLIVGALLCGMAVVGGYSQLLWERWMMKTKTTVSAEAPPFIRSSQHYFFKKQPLPLVIETTNEKADGADVNDMDTEASQTEENTIEESEDKASLRARVKDALSGLAQ